MTKFRPIKRNLLTTKALHSILPTQFEYVKMECKALDANDLHFLSLNFGKSLVAKLAKKG